MTHLESEELRSLARFDDLDFWAAKPFDVFARLRREAPVYWCDAGAFWVLTSYTDVRNTLLDWQTFTVEGGKVMADNYPLEQVAPMLPDWAKARLAEHGLSRAQQRNIVNLGRWNLEVVEGQLGKIDPPRNTIMRRLFTQGALHPE